MNEYIEAFKEALARTDAIAGGSSNYPLKITPGSKIDIPQIVDSITRDFP
ncbi:MAG: hypothetical protein ACNJA3_28125 (plasmid) [Pseudomonas rhizophila]